LLFAQGSAQFNPQHVALFDGILKGLLSQADSDVRADLAGQLAALVNAPPLVVRDLVLDAEIKVAGPLLQASPLVDESTLVEIARMRGQQHLLAISQRVIVPESVTDVILRRGEREVVRNITRNVGAMFSAQGYSGLVQRAADDGMLAVTLGQREDLPGPMLQQLLSESADIVRRKLFQTANPARRATIARTMVEMSAESLGPASQHDFASAQKAIIALHSAGKLDQDAVARFAKERKYEETIVALAAISDLTIEAVDQIIVSGRRDSILILGRALGLEWTIVRALISLRLVAGRALSAADVEDARINFERLALPTAQRVVKFWKERGQF
jgi:uncharacterized protein (DUF2336 family)